jgi:hypothetical protein
MTSNLVLMGALGEAKDEKERLRTVEKAQIARKFVSSPPSASRGPFGWAARRDVELTHLC